MPAESNPPCQLNPILCEEGSTPHGVAGLRPSRTNRYIRHFYDLYIGLSGLTQASHYYSPGYRVHKFVFVTRFEDRLCGLVVRVSGYRYRGPGFDSRRYQIF
jgi:hypothetical protein